MSKIREVHQFYAHPSFFPQVLGSSTTFLKKSFIKSFVAPEKANTLPPVMSVESVLVVAEDKF